MAYSKSTVHFKAAFQYNGNPERCKRVCRTYAALPHNASDPFIYARELNYLMRGIYNVAELEKLVNQHLATMGHAARVNVTNRCGWILEQNS